MNKTCIVCNTFNNTNVNSPGVIYHGIPKNDYMKRKWLEVMGIVRCHDWHKIYSDHFLEENYKPGLKRFLFSNAIPQPYDRYGFPSNYATKSNDVETENNIILPIIRRLAYYDECDDIESEFYREKHIEDAVANSFKSTRRQSILTGNNGDMSNTNMPDHISGSGLRCSVKNCFNRLSKNLSLFGIPKDFTLRKKWMEKCGIKKDLTKIVISATRVCSTHFEHDFFVPSLYLDNDC